jgi:uncharacterized protein (TIGR02678 family)
MREQVVAEELRMALHDLIDRILITRQASSDAYRRIFLHYNWLRDWFRERTGWRLVQWEDSYRLERVPSLTVPGRGVEGLRDGLDYACFCWILWFASSRAGKGQDWFALSELSRDVQEISIGRFTLESRRHRESFVRALQLLQRLGVLNPYSGNEEDWVRADDRSDPNAEVLYDLAPGAPRLLAVLSDSVYEALETAPTNRRTMHLLNQDVTPLQRAWRALLLGPGLWAADDPEAFEALREHAQEVFDVLQQHVEWGLEMGLHHARVWRTTSARGASGLLVDVGIGTRDEGTETSGPLVRYIFHPVLLLIGKVRDELTAGRLQAGEFGEIRIPEGNLRDYLIDVADRHRSQWGADMQKLSMAHIVDSVYGHMRRIGYLRGPDATGYCFILPMAANAIGYYVPERERLAPTPRSEAEPGQMSFFALVDDQQ